MVPCVTDGRGDFASRVELVSEGGESLADLNAARFGAFVNFVADAPEEDAWMIAVAQNHAFKIALPPLLEVEVIILRIFVAGFPAIKSFVDDEHAEAIAGVEEIA